MFDHDRLLHQIAIRNRGLVTRVAALAAGVPMHAIDDRVRAGLLVVWHDGVYRHSAVPITPEMRLLAAVLACGPGSVISGRPAATLHGFPGVHTNRLEVTTPQTDLPVVKGVTCHRALRLPPFERAIVRGIPVTAKGKTALDLCARTPFTEAQEVISQAVIQKLIRPEAILAAIERSGGRGKPGTVRLRAVAETLDELVGIESVLERMVAQIADATPVPRPIRQHEMTCADGRVVRLDLAWPHNRVSLESDGKRWHGTPARKRKTLARHQSIVESGWLHAAVGWAEAHDDPGSIRAWILDAHRQRSDELAA